MYVTLELVVLVHCGYLLEMYGDAKGGASPFSVCKPGPFLQNILCYYSCYGMLPTSSTLNRSPKIPLPSAKTLL